MSRVHAQVAHRPRTGKPVVGRLFEGTQYVQASGVDVAVDEIVELLTPREHAKGYMPLDGTLLYYCRQAFRLDETKTVLLHNKPVEFKGCYGGKAQAGQRASRRLRHPRQALCVIGSPFSTRRNRQHPGTKRHRSVPGMPFQVNSERHFLHRILDVVTRHPDAGKAAPDDGSQSP